MKLYKYKSVNSKKDLKHVLEIIEDKKIYYIRPTKKALDIKDDIYKCNEEKYQQLLEEMTIEEIIQMDSLIKKFNSILNKF